MGALDGIFNRVRPVVPRHESGPGTKGVGQGVAHAVPVGCAKTKMIFHFLAFYFLFRVVMLESEAVSGIFALERDFGNVSEKFGHVVR